MYYDVCFACKKQLINFMESMDDSQGLFPNLWVLFSIGVRELELYAMYTNSNLTYAMWLQYLSSKAKKKKKTLLAS